MTAKNIDMACETCQHLRDHLLKTALPGIGLHLMI